MRLRYLLGSLAMMLAVSSAQAGILDGLNAYWTFDGNGLDTAADIGSTASAVADNGMVVPGSRTSVTLDRPGKFGMAASFDGVDSYIAVPDSVDINKEGQDLSISAWFQVDAFDTSWQALLAKGEGSNYRIARQGDTNFMAYAGGARDIRPDPAPAASPTNPGDGLWHNVVATTTNGGGVSLWVDGALVEDAGNVDQVAAIVNDRSTDPPELWIGNNPGSPGREWEGGIDEVAIWGRVLSEGEIASIWNGGDGASIPQLAIPEPASGLLMALGMLGLLAAGRTRRN